MKDPIWLAEARKHVGLRETKGPEHTPNILQWWKDIKLGGVKDDETPWCAAYVGAMLETVGLVSTRSGWARSYLNWGHTLDDPEYGCVVVFAREGGGGHVGFVVGRDEKLRLLVLGGNQSDAVNIKSFDHSRILGFRWPELVKPPVPAPLPVLAAAELSTRES